MSNPNKPAFSDWTLNMAEYFQYYTGKYAIGRAVTSLFTGSPSRSYEQLLWLPRSRVQKSEVNQTAWVAGDPHARGTARRWERSTILGFDKAEMDELKAQENAKEAVAYISDKVVHVGIMATEGALFNKLSEKTVAVAMRRRAGDVEFTGGVYLPEAREFTSVSAAKPIEVVEQSFHIHALSLHYPGIKLV